MAETNPLYMAFKKKPNGPIKAGGWHRNLGRVEALARGWNKPLSPYTEVGIIVKDAEGTRVLRYIRKSEEVRR